MPDIYFPGTRIRRPDIWELMHVVDDDHWIVGGNLIVSHHHQERPDLPLNGASWGDSKGGFYTIAPAPKPLPPSRQLPKQNLKERAPDESCLWQIIDSSYGEAVWSVGDATLTVRVVEPQTTREHVTLNHLEGLSLSFRTPEVLFNAEYGDIYYLVTRKVPGLTVGRLWPEMDGTARENCVSGLVKACQELAMFTSSPSRGVCGVDGGEVIDMDIKMDKSRVRWPPDVLLKGAESFGMDCSILVLSHNGLTLDCVNVDAEGRLVGLKDWSLCGFFPRTWIRSKIFAERAFPEPWLLMLREEFTKAGFCEDISALVLEKRNVRNRAKEQREGQIE